MMSESGTTRLCIAYVLRRFPVLSETFVTHEILELRRAGVRVLVLSLLKSQDKIVTQDVLEVCQQDVYYAPFLSIPILARQVGAMMYYPLRYLRTLATTVFEKKPAVLDLAKALAVFPKSVHFGRLCRQAGVSHIHAHWPGLATLGAEVVSTICGVPFSFTVHTIGDIEYVGLYEQSKHARTIRAISHYHRLLMTGRFPEFADKVEMIRVMSTWSDERVQRQDIRLSYRRCGQVLAIGRLIEKKGFRYLIEAVRILRARGVRIQCQIVGDGPLRDMLADMIQSYDLEEMFQLVGAVPHERVFVYLSECDVLVVPSVRVDDKEGMEDGLPLVILEAMTVGKPVVTTDAGAICETVQDGVTGLLVPQGDSERLADAIEHLLANPRLCHEIGMQAKGFINEEFDSLQTVRALMEVFTN